MSSPLGNSVQYLKGIGPGKASILRDEVSLETIEDLLYYAPRRYRDRSSFRPVSACGAGETVTVNGIVESVTLSGRRKVFLEVRINDGTGSLSGVFFGGITYFQKLFKTGDRVLFSGKVEIFRNRQIVHPEFDFIEEENDSRIRFINTGRLVPLYPTTEKLRAAGFDSRGLRRIIHRCLEEFLDDLTDPFDTSSLLSLGLMGLREAILKIHFPDDLAVAGEARKRLAFNELYLLQRYIILSRESLRLRDARETGRISLTMLNAFLGKLPFPLTGDQKRVIEEIRGDMDGPFPMNRMLQGDVGSGKTVIAIAAALLCTGRGEQAAVMAPTEVLALQHYDTFSRFLPEGVSCSVITGKTPSPARSEILRSLAGGGTDIIIGTHSLIQDSVDFSNLGLIVIDEQHRFGVNQRAALRQKGSCTDLLVMTATPIPRSLSLTLYGDLDSSLLREKPSGRQDITTLAFPESRIAGVHKSMEKYISQGRQVYVILPLIQESEKSDLKSAEATFALLKDTVFPHRRVSLLHGKMQGDDKSRIMAAFKNGEIDIIVSTTVIEVGIDVPNACVIIIHHPERFGLSQLHQLRGRVGRGDLTSYCLLFTDSADPKTMTRLKTLETVRNGPELAEYDLMFRGEGDVLGIRQHGLPALALASLRDRELLEQAKEALGHILKQDPDLTGFPLLREEAEKGTIEDGIQD